MKGRLELVHNYATQFLENLDIETTFFADQISNNLDYISAYNRFCRENEDFIENNPKRLQDFHEFAYSQYNSYFPYIVNGSLLITLDSYFDNKFYILTKKISDEALNSFNIKNSNGTCINKCFDHITNKLKLKISKGNKHWENIFKKHTIRNLIVHNNSSLEVFDNNMTIKSHPAYELISNCSYIEITNSSGKFYIIDKTFLLDYLKDIRSFLNLVLKIGFGIDINYERDIEG